MALLQMTPGPADRAVERRIGERRQIVGHLLHRDVALDVAHQRAEHFGVMRAAQRVEQRLLVALARALPGLMARIEVADEIVAVEAAVQQALVGEFVDHAGVAHQIAHRPAREAEQAQQPRLHLGPLDEQREVALAPQQRLDPVDEAQRRIRRAAIARHRVGGARHQLGQAQLALVAQALDARLRAPLAHALAQALGQALDEGFAVHRQRRGAAAAAAGLALLRHRRLAVVQQRVELGGHQLACGAQPLEQLAGVGVAAQVQAACNPAQVIVTRGQQMRLLVIEVLDAMLDAAQEGVGRGQRVGGGRLHQPAGGQALQALQGGARADLGELAAAHDEQQLHDELDLADAAARQLHIVGAVGAAGGAALRLVAHLAVQLAQPLEHAVVEVAAVDEGGDRGAQRQRAAALDTGARRDDAALQPGEALPLAALHEEILLQHRQAHHRRPRHAVGSQREVDTEHEAYVGDVADQRIKPSGDLREIFVCGDR